MRGTDFTTNDFMNWIDTILQPENCTYVVCVERKATALLRMYCERKEGPSWLNWSKILSSDAIDYMQKGSLNGEHVLIFNEMIHHGKSTVETAEKIIENSSEVATIKTAAFVTHYELERSEDWNIGMVKLHGNSYPPDFVAHRDVIDSEYKEYRNDIVDALRCSGALLLDTEHIETRFQLLIPIGEFLKELCNIGLPVEYENEDTEGLRMPWNIGITIRDPVISDFDRLKNMLPKGSDIMTNEPKKIRLVRRGPDEFAFISIWYPRIPVENIDAYIESESVPDSFKPAIQECDKKNIKELIFCLSGLIASIELLRSVWTVLSPLVKSQAISYFVPSDGIALKDPLGHLHSLYPNLDFKKLASDIKGLLSYENKEEVARVSKLRKELKSYKEGLMPAKIDSRTKLNLIRILLKTFVNRRANKSYEFYEIGPKKRVDPLQEAFSWRDLWKEGERLGIDENVRSVTMDYLIDNAILKTTHMRTWENGKEFIARAYAFDSEYAIEEVKRLALT